jgi:hypothetical protein
MQWSGRALENCFEERRANITTVAWLKEGRSEVPSELRKFMPRYVIPTTAFWLQFPVADTDSVQFENSSVYIKNDGRLIKSNPWFCWPCAVVCFRLRLDASDCYTARHRSDISPSRGRSGTSKGDSRDCIVAANVFMWAS